MGRTKLTVVLIIVCAVKCLAMTYDELEDFAEHLKKTSQLSPTLKKGADPDVDYDDDEIVSDHAWEDSGKFEGDLILNERQRRLIVEDVAEGLARNGISDGTKRWPNNEVIVYIQREHFSGDQVQAIESGIDDLARASCVKFRPYKKGDRDAVVIQGNRRGCFSQVGYQGGYQVLNLSGRHPVGRGCFRHGTVVHELLHTLGFYHMQSSPDRDDYVNIVWANIVQPARHNFRKYNSFSVSDFGVGYDYDSVLHYSRRAFSSNGQDTIVPKQSGAEIGQRTGLSDKDTKKLNKMYCDADWDNGQADESPPKKTETKKKNGKNKPFEGHGIGYHQGKAVAIKILPAAETFMLPDVPSFHVFDYFSKEPQILSPSENEGFRIGKKIAYSPPKAIQHHQTTPESHSPVHLETELKLTNHNKENFHGRNVADVKQTNSQIEKHLDHQADPELAVDNSTHDDHSSPPDEKVVDADLIDAFDRLSKIIKMHVYPSQTPDLSVYKMNGHYNNHYDSPQIKEVSDMKFVSPVAIEANKQEENKIHSAIRFINNMYEAKYDPKSPIKDKSKKTVPDRESNPPWYKHYEEDYNFESDFKPLEHYRENNEYTRLYSPKIHKNEKPNENHDDWYEKHIENYPDHDYSEESSKGHEHDGHEKEIIYSPLIPKRTQDYSAYRFPAKVTKKWYNDDSHVYR